MTPVSVRRLAAALTLGLASTAWAQDGRLAESPAGPGHEVIALWPQGAPGAEQATARAAAFAVDPKRVGVIGFSAGGHVAGVLTLKFDQPTYRAIDAADLASARPDAPPVFLVHAVDDASVPVENSLELFDALRAQKVPVEMHLFEEGGHGFGIQFAVGKPAAAWPDLVLAWMRRRGF